MLNSRFKSFCFLHFYSLTVFVLLLLFVEEKVNHTFHGYFTFQAIEASVRSTSKNRSDSKERRHDVNDTSKSSKKMFNFQFTCFVCQKPYFPRKLWLCLCYASLLHLFKRLEKQEKYCLATWKSSNMLNSCHVQKQRLTIKYFFHHLRWWYTYVVSSFSQLLQSLFRKK